MTNQEIKDTGLLIKNEQQIGGNTALRVGGVIEGIGYALDNKDAANGYYQATINGGLISVNAPNFVLGTGGNLRIKMPAAGTTASTLTIGNANAVQLWYNGAAVSSDNTWEANEIISVFYDGTRFMASNSQGGGGSADKIYYDNSQSGLAAENVQGALDELVNELYNKEEVAISSLPVTSGYCILGTGNWYQNSNVSFFAMPVSQGDRIMIVADSTNACIFAILKNLTISRNNPANFATGETGVRAVDAAKSVVVEITQSDAAYLYFTKMANASTDRSPSHIYKLQSLAEGIEENANNISDTIGLHVTSAMPKVRLNKEGYYTSSGTIGSQWTRYRDDYPAEPNMRYIVSSGHTGFGAGSGFAVYVIAFLDSNLNVLGGITPDQVGSAIITDYAVTTPSNCAYISLCKYQTTYATSVFKSPTTKNSLVEHEERLEKMYEGQCAAIIAQDVKGYWTNAGVLTTASYTRYHDNYMVKPNTKYLVSCGHTGFGVGANMQVYVIAFLDSGGNCLSGIEPDSTVSPVITDWEVTTPSNCVTISIVKYQKTRETKVIEVEKSVPYLIEQVVTKRAFNRFLDGKKYSIVGDSISTYKDLLAASEYAYKYPFDDVTDPALTWWRKMEKYTGLRLLKNCSWSGSRVSGDSTSTSTAAAGCSTKRVKDLAVRDSGGNIVTAPDIILVYMSINDFRFDGMGTWTPSNALPTEGNLTTWREAYATMVSKIIREYPNAEVYCCTLLECTLGVIDVDDNTAFPVINGNGVSLAQWNDSIKEIAIGFGAKVCDIHGCGISYWQVANYTGDLCHPNAAGMELIARKVTQELKAKSFYVI